VGESIESHLRKHHEKVRQKNNLDILKSGSIAYVKEKGGIVPEETPARLPLSKRDGDPESMRRSVDALEWDTFKRCVPGGDKYEEAVVSIAESICNKETNTAEIAMLSESLTSLTREIVKGILAVKTKQAEKPVQMNTQFNVDTSAFPLTRDAGRRVLRGPKKKGPAMIDSSAPSQPSGSEDRASTSHPDSPEPDAPPAS